MALHGATGRGACVKGELGVHTSTHSTGVQLSKGDVENDFESGVFTGQRPQMLSPPLGDSPQPCGGALGSYRCLLWSCLRACDSADDAAGARAAAGASAAAGAAAATAASAVVAAAGAEVDASAAASTSAGVKRFIRYGAIAASFYCHEIVSQC